MTGLIPYYLQVFERHMQNQLRIDGNRVGLVGGYQFE